MKIKIYLFTLFLSVHALCNAMQQATPRLSPEEIIQRYNQATTLVRNNRDLEQAEALLLPIRNLYEDQNHSKDAYRILLIIAVRQNAQQNTPESAAKIILYAEDAVHNGFPLYTSEIGFGYERLGIYEMARKYYEDTLKLPNASPQTYVNLANLLWKGQGGPRDRQRAVRYYQVAYKAGNEDGIYPLATAYASGDGTTQAPQEAYTLYSKIIKDPSHESYTSACADLGFMYEINLIKPSKGETNISEAIKYFSMAKDAESQDMGGIARGKAHIARLIWTNKIPGDKEQAKRDLTECAQQGDDLALYLYSAILINQGDIDKALNMLIRTYERKSAPTLVTLQLAIAYQDGWGNIPENKASARVRFNSIITDTDKVFRSSLLARAYMYIMGIGVEQNEREGFRLLEESKTKADDVSLDIYALFPVLRDAESKYHARIEQARRELLEAEERKKEKKAAKKEKRKGKAPAGKPSAQEEEEKEEEEEETPALPAAGTSVAGSAASHAAASAAATLPTTHRNILHTSPEDWNSFWAIGGDGSTVSEVKRAKSSGKITVTIDDPTRGEQLIVQVDPMPYRYFDDLRELIYDPRVLERQKTGTVQEQRSHNFAKILDYVIQCAGKLSLFAKDGSDQPKDQIIATVTRVNKDTKQETRCKAEYTFYKDRSGKPHLYHRLLRPMKY